MLTLALETSCDETAAAVLDGERRVLSSVISSQMDRHALYGGVVPELASRWHLNALEGVTAEALARAGVTVADLCGIGVTRGPGLIGALLTGVTFARGLALQTGKPLVGVHHIEGHALSGRLAEPAAPFPYLALVASGAHTALYRIDGPGRYRTVGQCLNDAAGEAFDKSAKLMGLPYPGGAVLNRLAEQGDPARFEFPRALWRRDSFDFSFSGLKTAVRQTVQGLVAAGGGVLSEGDRADVAASVRQAVVDVLLFKAIGAATALRVPHLVIAGGVAANSLLRREAALRTAKARIGLTIAPLAYCTDNAAMIGVAAWHRLAHGQRDDVRSLTAFASGPLDAEVLK